jgi:uncharacterized delta-60 repeat protein
MLPSKIIPTPRRNTQSERLWQSIRYGLLITAIVCSAFCNIFLSPRPATAAISQPSVTPAQVQPKETETETEPESPRDKTTVPAPDNSPGTNAITPPTRNALSGTPFTFSNSGNINIADNSTITPYPSNINVSGIPITITGVTVSLDGFSHKWPDDIDILLVAPGGQNTLLMSDAGDSFEVNNLTLNFDDAATASLPRNSVITSGTFKPTNYNLPNATDTFPAPAPGSSPYSVTLSVFNGINPNGTWQLFVRDDYSGLGGNISRGWALTLYTAPGQVVELYSGNNQNTQVATAFPTQLQARVRDSSDNPVSGATITFTAPPQTGASGTFAGGGTSYTGVSDASGIVTSSAFSANTVAGSYGVTVTASTLPYSSIFALTNLTGPVASLTPVSGSGQLAAMTTAFAQPLVARAQDVYNNVVSGATVTFTVPVSGASGTFAGNQTSFTGTTAASGLITTSIFSANGTTGTYNVTAKSATNATTNFALTNAPDSQIQFQSSSYSVREGIGTALITLTRQTSFNFPVSATVIASATSASNTDFRLIDLVTIANPFFPAESGFNDEVTDILVQPDNKILVSGYFTTVDSNDRKYVARLNPDGSLDTSFNPGGSADVGSVHIALQPDGKIIIAGNFTTYAGIGRIRVARLNSDGSLDTTFNPGQGANGPINKVILQPDGKIIIVGYFTTYAGISRPRLARLNSDGTLDTSFNPGDGANNIIWDAILQPDGKLVIGGRFDRYNTVSRYRLARVNSDGSLDTNFSEGANDDIRSLALQPDGKIILGGDFTSYSNTNVNRITRINSDGTRDTSFKPQSGANIGVRPILVLPDGKIIIGGDFTQYDEKDTPYFARLNSDGTLDTTFSITSGSNAFVGALQLYNTNQVLVGGRFTAFNGQTFNRLLQLVEGATVSWGAGDTSPKTVSLVITNDELIEPDEQLVLRIAKTGVGATTGTPVSTTVTILDDESLSLSAVLGNNQSTAVNTTFAQPLVAKIVNSNNSLLPGVVVTFTAPTSGANGKFANGSNVYTGTTDATGVVTTSVFTANGLTGSYFVTANAAKANTTLYFALTNNIGAPAGIIGINGSGQTALVGQAFSQPFVAIVRDSGNNFVSNATVTFTAPASGASGTFAGGQTTYSAVTDASGVVTSSIFTANNLGGSYSVTATVAGVSTPANFSLTNTGNTITIQSGNNQTAKPGESFSQPLAVLVRDTANNPLGWATVTFTAPGSGASGTFAGGQTTYVGVTDGAGVLTTPIFTANSLQGSYNVTATAADTVQPAVFTLNNSTGTEFNGAVNDIALQSDGKILVVGNFTAYNGVTRKYIARLNSDRTLDTSFDPGVSTNVSVTNVVLQADGKLLIAGSFTTYQNQNFKYLARLNSNGSLDTGFTIGSNLTSSGSNPIVRLLRHSDNKLFIVGNFSLSVGNVSYSSAVRLNADGTFDNSFNAGIGVSNSGTVYDAALQADGKLLVVGDFTAFNTTTSRNLVRLTTSGAVDNSFDPGVSANGSIRSVAVQPDGKILIGGDFTSYVNISRIRIARLNSDAGLDINFEPDAGANNRVRSILPQADGSILLGGDFTTYANIASKHLALLNSDGSLETNFNFGGGSGTDGNVNVLRQQNAYGVLAGGSFTSYNNSPANNLAQVNLYSGLAFGVGNYSVSEATGTAVITLTRQFDTGAAVAATVGIKPVSADANDFLLVTPAPSVAVLDQSFPGGAGFDQSIYAVLKQPDGKILIAGNFTNYGGVQRLKIARLNSDRTLDTSFNPGTSVGTDKTIEKLVLQPDGKILIAGNFTEYGGVARTKIARLNADGSLDTSFTSGFSSAAASNPTQMEVISSIVVQPDGKMLVGGRFTSYNGTTIHHLLRLNSDGSLDTNFNSANGLNNGREANRILALALQPDGKLLIGGDFTQYGGVGRNNIARLNADGSLDTNFDPGAGAQGQVNVLTLQTDGKIMVGGSFLTFNNQFDPNIARLNANGSVDTGFVSGYPNAGPTFIEVLPNGKYLMGGYFSGYGGCSSERLVQINSNGSCDTSYSFGTGFDGPVFTAQRLADGTLLIAGNFGNYDGTNVKWLARLYEGVRISWAAGDASPKTITLSITNDTLAEGNEQIEFGLVALTGRAKSDQPLVATLTIVDNDAACNALVVTSLTDNGQANICGTLSYALLNASSGVTITFALTQGNTITFTGSLTPSLKAGVNLNGGNGANGVIMNGNGVAGDGLRLVGGGSTLSNLTVQRFAGRELVISNAGSGNVNKLYNIRLET